MMSPVVSFLGILLTIFHPMLCSTSSDMLSDSLDGLSYPGHIHVGKIARQRLSPDDVEFFEKLQIPPDRPDQFLKDSSNHASLHMISQEQKNELIFLGSLASAAYCERDLVLNWACGIRCDQAGRMNITRHFRDPTSDVWGFVGVHHRRREIFIVFRGSSSFKNWIYNLYFSMTSVPWKSECLGLNNPTLHEGFLLAYESVSSVVSSEVQKLLAAHPSYPIRVVGHSLGGALATICAMELHDFVRRKSRVRLTTFESPRVGNDDFAKLVRRHFPDPMDRIRVTNGRDIVVRLPPYILGYRHASREVFIPLNSKENSTAYLCDDSNGEDSRCSNAHYAYSIDDHLYYPWGLEYGIPC